jgi:hypothetical protein
MAAQRSEHAKSPFLVPEGHAANYNKLKRLLARNQFLVAGEPLHSAGASTFPQHPESSRYDRQLPPLLLRAGWASPQILGEIPIVSIKAQLALKLQSLLLRMTAQAGIFRRSHIATSPRTRNGLAQPTRNEGILRPAARFVDVLTSNLQQFG